MRLAPALLLTALCAWPEAGRAQAQDEPTDRARAGALFEQGLADMLAGKLDTGCPTLAQSYALAPLPGALFTLAECEARWGKAVAALEHYDRYLTELTRLEPDKREAHEPRRVIAVRQIEALRLSIPKLTLLLPPAVRATPSVSVDDEPVAAAMLGTELRLDPGVHRIEVKAPGHEPSRSTLELRQGQTRTVVLELGVPTAPPPPPDAGAADAGDAQRTWAYVVGAVGLVGLAVGAITGGLALGQKGIVRDNCSDHLCNTEGKSAADLGQTLADVSTISLIVGGSAFATGAVLWLTAPSGEIGGQGEGAMLRVGGTW